LSELIEIDDLRLLDGKDLRAVFSQVSEPQLVDALSGAAATLREQLLKKLPPGTARRIATQVTARGPIPPAAVQQAQRALVAALCRLSRGGQVAFDIPGDMVA
jgi:flagellar motor switch protein FliG